MTEQGKLIRTDEELKVLTEKLMKTDVIAVDTEFHGERRYWPELFLVQIADEENGPLAVDPLAVSSLSPMCRVMQNKAVIKVIHSSRNDIAILRRVLGCEINSVFDTQVAAGFLGFGEQVSLDKLIHKLCGNSSHKRFSLSDWSARPLSKEQLEYALDDVRFLLPMYRKMVDKLQKTGRTKWFQDEMTMFSSKDAFVDSVIPAYRRTRSSGKIKKRSLPLLWALVNWREEQARQQNRPRNSIIRDNQLCRIAVMAPRDMKTLEVLRGIPSGTVTKWGGEIISVIKSVSESPPSDIPVLPEHISDSGVSARADILRIFLKQKSSSMGIATSLLLPKETFKALIENPPLTLKELMNRNDIAGWRREALGEELIALLSGRLALALEPNPCNGVSFKKTD